MAHILVVEDSPLLATIMRLGLESGGHSVRVAGDGHAALEAARAGRFDLMLLDVLLPGLDGFDVLTQMKTHATTAALPVFMLTGQSDGSSIRHGLDRGADAYFSKPVDMLDLLARIAHDIAQPRPSMEPAGQP